MKHLRIGFDGRHFLGTGGIDRYSRELARALAMEFTKECSIDIFSIRRKEQHFYPFFAECKNVNIKSGFLHHFMLGYHIEPLLRYYNDSILIQKNMKKCDVYHCTNTFFYCSTPTPTVSTIHDLFPFYEHDWAQTFLGTQAKKMQATLRKSMLESRAILVQTETLKREVIEFIPELSPEKVFVAIPAGGTLQHNDPALLQQFGISPNDSYFLHVGRYDPRKNLFGMLEAFAELHSSLPESIRENVKFVYAGNINKPDLPTFYQKIESLHLGSAFIHVRGASDEVVSSLYCNALCFAFASFAEGFGLPVLEAMQCACPVLTSNTSSLPEVVGNAALLVNPYDIHDMHEGMKKILMNPSLRDDLRHKGLQRNREFSWERCAHETMKAYQFACS